MKLYNFFYLYYKVNEKITDVAEKTKNNANEEKNNKHTKADKTGLCQLIVSTDFRDYLTVLRHMY